MKVKEIKLTNFARYDSVKASFDDRVTYLIGKNGAGKSTLGLSAIWFMFQGIAEKSSAGNTPLIGERFRFIGPKQATAKGEMVLHDEKTGTDIKVIRKLTKHGSDLSFEAPPGQVLNQQWLNDLFNVFLIAPKRFQDLTPKEQARALGIDTTKYDADLAKLKLEFTAINAVVRSFGELLPVEKVERVDMDQLMLEKGAIRNKLNVIYLENKKKNEEARAIYLKQCDGIRADVSAFNQKQIDNLDHFTTASAAADTLRLRGFEHPALQEFIERLKAEVQPHKTYEAPPEPEYIAEMPDNSELLAVDEKIAEAGKTNEAALLYEQYTQKKAVREQKENELAENKKKQQDVEADRVNYIKNFNFPQSGLTVAEGGELLLEGKPIKEPYFSTGELLRIIPNLFAALQPELKYVFLQDFNLLDEETQAAVEKDLTDAGFQLVIELVGKEKLEGENCILLRDNKVVEEPAGA